MILNVVVYLLFLVPDSYSFIFMLIYKIIR
nr:MAG TPA: hypothetical protein [Caudoviricetes sp.]